MELFWEEFSFGTGDWNQLTRVILRMVMAAIFGGIMGFERERAGKPAGLRTHVLVTLGTCVFVLAGIGYGMSSDGLSRVIQGIITGIGFIGAGSILKLNDQRDVQGLTTSASVWMAAAVGVSAGLGELGLALIATMLSLIVLALLGKVEAEVVGDNQKDPQHNDRKN